MVILGSLGITDMKFRKFKSKILLTITLERPGLLIGRYGKTIDALKKRLSDLKNFPVEIFIIESRLWY
jgi:ribosomal protein S3